MSKFNELKNFLFGHAESIFVAPIHQTITSHIPGALQPIVDWFNRQHFTQTGIRWLHELTTALLQSGAWNNLWNNVKQMAAQAGAAAGHAFAQAAMDEITNMLNQFNPFAGFGSGPDHFGSGGRLGTPGQAGQAGLGGHATNSARVIVGGRGRVTVHMHVHGASLDHPATLARVAHRLGGAITRGAGPPHVDGVVYSHHR